MSDFTKNCDRCNKDITVGFHEDGGNCPECGDDLCYDCAGWENIDNTTMCSRCAEFVEAEKTAIAAWNERNGDEKSG